MHVALCARENRGRSAAAQQKERRGTILDNFFSQLHDSVGRISGARERERERFPGDPRARVRECERETGQKNIMKKERNSEVRGEEAAEIGKYSAVAHKMLCTSGPAPDPWPPVALLAWPWPWALAWPLLGGREVRLESRQAGACGVGTGVKSEYISCIAILL